MTRTSFTPLTRPTGFVPASARATVTTPQKADDSDAEAATVKAAYVAERSAWESFKAARSVTYRPPKSYDGIGPVTIDDELQERAAQESAWRKVARWCRTRKLDPAAYIQVVFTSLDRARTRAPEPHQLCTDVCYAIWIENSEKVAKRIGAALESERASAARQVAYHEAGGETREEALVLVLVSDATPISPLFRYCMARQIVGPRFERLAAFWEKQAVAQFRRYREQYLATWGGVLPEGFLAVVDRLGAGG